MSGSFWSGQQVEYALTLNPALFLLLLCNRHGNSTILSESHSCSPGFFSPKAMRKAILFVWFWWEREEPAAEVPPCKHKHTCCTAMQVHNCSSEPDGFASEVLCCARGYLDFRTQRAQENGADMRLYFPNNP